MYQVFSSELVETQDGEWRVVGRKFFLTATELMVYSETHQNFTVETVQYAPHRSGKSGLASGSR